MNRSPRAAGFAGRTAAITATVVALSATAGAAVPTPPGDRNSLEQQRKGVSGRITDAKKAFDESSRAYVRASNSLKVAQVRLGAAKAHLGQTQHELAGAQALDAKLKVQLDAAEVDLAKAKVDLERGKRAHEKSALEVQRFTVQNLTQGDPGLEAFGDLLRGEDPMTFSERMTVNRSISDAQIAKMQQLAADKVILQLNEDQVAKLRDRVAAARAETERNVVRQQRLTTQAQAQTVEVDRLVDSRASAQAAAQKVRADDERKLRELEEDRQRLEARIAALVAAEKAKAADGENIGDGGGTLSHPINGPITSPYGMRVHPITHRYKLHDGTDFGASCGTPIHAAAGGQIIEQYYNGGYGNRVIMNNGVMKGHVIVTAYNHLSRYALKVGDKVNRGDVVGYVGSTGYSTGCHLHFMVLVDGHTTNPIGWL